MADRKEAARPAGTAQVLGEEGPGGLSREAKEPSGKNLGNFSDVGGEGHPVRSLIGIPGDLLGFASEVWQKHAPTPV